MDETVNSKDTAVTGYRYHTDKLTLIGKTGTANYTQMVNMFLDNIVQLDHLRGYFLKMILNI